MRWAEITIHAHPDSAEIASDLLISQGCAGAMEKQSSDAGGDYSTCSVGYLPVDDRLEDKLKRIKARLVELVESDYSGLSPEVVVTWVEDEDWANAWKQFFKPARMGKVVIKPSWEEFSPESGDVVVELDPGMAFGTGSHPTTQLCLYILQDIITGGEVVFDIGCGSGILSMAAAGLGAAEVWAVDNDPVAVKVATENVENAGLSGVVTVFEADSPSAISGDADVVVANIIPIVIIGMAEALAEKVRVGGKLLVSGIITERESDVTTALESVGLVHIETRPDGDWVAIVFRR